MWSTKGWGIRSKGESDMKLVQPEALKKWNETYAKGTDKKFPSIDLVRLQLWFFEHPGKGKLLEYGCGTGVNTLHLLECGYEVCGVDAAQGSLDMVGSKLQEIPHIKENCQLQKIDSEADRLPFIDGMFEFVVCISVLSLLGSKERMQHLLDEFRRVTAPGGKLILDINDSNSDFSRKSEHIGNNIYLFRGPDGNEDTVPTYCLPDEDSFVQVVNPYFEIIDVGFSGHEYFGSRINEWIICCEKI